MNKRTGINSRPYVSEFLAYCSQNFNLAIWTAASLTYAKIIAEKLFKDIELEFIWSKEQCTKEYDAELMEYFAIKNLNKLKQHGYKMPEILIIDNTPETAIKNYGNLIQIKDWEGDREDTELLKLVDYLDTIKNHEDIRTIDKRNWNK